MRIDVKVAYTQLFMDYGGTKIATRQFIKIFWIEFLIYAAEYEL